MAGALPAAGSGTEGRWKQLLLTAKEKQKERASPRLAADNAAASSLSAGPLAKPALEMAMARFLYKPQSVKPQLPPWHRPQSDLLSLGKEHVLEVAGHLKIEDVYPLERTCRELAEWCNDAVLGDCHIQQESWQGEFEFFRSASQATVKKPAYHWLSEQTSLLPTSLQARYCRRRIALQRLLQSLPQSLLVWSIDDTNEADVMQHFLTWLSSLEDMISSSPAWRQIDDAPVEVNEVSVSGTISALLELASATEQRDSASGDDPLGPHPGDACASTACPMFLGDMTDLLHRGLPALRAGPVRLFGPMELIFRDPYHEVDVVIRCRDRRRFRAMGAASSNSTHASEDTSAGEEWRFAAAFSEWMMDSIEESKQVFTGRRLVLPPSGDLCLAEDVSSLGRWVTDDKPIVLVKRGRNRFHDKAEKVGMLGGAGLLVGDEHQSNHLFRMAGAIAQGGSSSERLPSDLPPALLLTGAAYEKLLKALQRGCDVRIEAIKPVTAPRAFICIGKMRQESPSTSPQGARPPRAAQRGGACPSSRIVAQADLWVPLDQETPSLGQVLLVRPDAPFEKARVMALSLTSFLRHMVELDKAGARALAQVIPEYEHVRADLRTGGSSEDTTASAQLVRKLVSPSSCRRVTHTVDPTTGLCQTRVRSCRIQRYWVPVHSSAAEAEWFRGLRPMVDMKVSTLLEGLDIGSQGSQLFMSSATTDILQDSCAMLEGFEAAQSTGADGSHSQAGDQSHLAGSLMGVSGVRGSCNVFQRVARYGPTYFQKRWCGNDEEPPHIETFSSCTATIDRGILTLRWALKNGQRGSFQKPFPQGQHVQIVRQLPDDVDLSTIKVQAGDWLLLPSGRIAPAIADGQVASSSSAMQGQDINLPDGSDVRRRELTWRPRKDAGSSGDHIDAERVITLLSPTRPDRTDEVQISDSRHIRVMLPRDFAVETSGTS